MLRSVRTHHLNAEVLSDETDFCEAERLDEFVDIVGYVFEREAVGEGRLPGAPGYPVR